MDFLNSNLPGALALDRLSDAVARELLMPGYTRRTMDRYKQVWERLVEFAQSQGGVKEYSRELVLRFEENDIGVDAMRHHHLGHRRLGHLAFGQDLQLLLFAVVPP